MRIYWSLFPLAWLYGCAVQLRNLCFDWGILKEHSFSVPVICLGNLTVGGTGKTPHTEYLIRLLKQQGKVAVLSRGYKRQTKGYLLADKTTSVSQIGDEPYQMKQKFPDILVAVDENRREGIQNLMALNPYVILLDDAYQHRYVKAKLNLLLTDYNRLITKDHMLPAGRLREPLEGKKRADLLIVTKCPHDISEGECSAIRTELKPESNQQVYFSTVSYGSLQKILSPAERQCLSAIKTEDNVLVLAGIANPTPLIEEIQKHTQLITPLIFTDHHAFAAKDMANIQSVYQSLSGKGKRWVITTEKDATRISTSEGWSQEFMENLWSLPIEVKILEGKEQEFNNRICKELK